MSNDALFIAKCGALVACLCGLCASAVGNYRAAAFAFTLSTILLLVRDYSKR